MRLKKLSRLLCVLTILSLILVSVPMVAHAAVSISKTGNIVTASNGVYTLTYDLSTGRGSLAYGSTTVINNFYSNFRLNGSGTRINSYDAGTRTATWVQLPANDGYGSSGWRLTFTCTLNSGYTLRTYINVYDNNRFILADMDVSKTASMTIDLMESVAADNLNIGNFTDERILTTPYTNNTDFGVCPVNNFGTFDGTSYWVCSVFDNAGYAGFVAGAATTPNWKSSQKLAAASTANGPLTGFAVQNYGGTQAGTTVASDRFFLGYYTDYRTGMEEYGAKYAVGEAPMAWSGAMPVGFNNYYSLRCADTLDEMKNIVDYIYNNMRGVGYNYVNLDATALTSAERSAFAAYCHNKSLKAGAYACPFTIWGAYLDDPVPGTSYRQRDAVLRDSAGNMVSWYLGSDVYVLDATSPAGQACLTVGTQSLINEGFDFLKIDFIDYGMQEGVHYDNTKNGIQSFRIGMSLIKQTVLNAGRPIFISESIAPLLPNGYAHARRSGCDTEIGVNVYSGYERQSLNSIASWFTNGTIWKYNDPDMTMVENRAGSEYWMNAMNANQARLLISHCATGGGFWLTSENLPLVPDDRMSQILLNNSVLNVAKLGKAARPVKMTNFLWLNEALPTVTYMTDTNGDKIVTATNWSKTASASVDVNWADIGLNSGTSYYVIDLFKNEKLGSFTTRYTATFDGASHDSMLLRITGTNPSQPAPAPNLALGKTWNASSYYSAGYEASKAGDGNWSTRWSAASTDGQWLEVDFGADTTVNRVKLKEYRGSEDYGNGFWVTDYTIQCWNGSDYVNLTKGNRIGSERILNFPTVTTRKLRVLFTGGAFLPSIREFAAYNISGNSAAQLENDDSDGTFSTYADIKQVMQRMQVFQAATTTLPRFDVFAYKVGEPKALSVSIYSLNASYNPVSKLFEADITPGNFPTGLQRIPVFCNLTGLASGSYYGIVFKSPASPDTGNCYGIGYSDSNPMDSAFERVSSDGGTTWSTENSGAKDLKVTLYAQPYAGGMKNDTMYNINYSGSWTASSFRGLGDFMNDVHYTSTNNDYVQYTFTGTGISYITEKNSDMGTVDVYIDNVLQSTADCYNATRLVKQTVYTKTGLTSGQHTIKVVKKTGTYMLVDAFNVVP